MKMMLRFVAVAVFFMAASAFAGNLDGTYKFNSRVKEGKPDMTGWTGTMTIKGDTMDREYRSADGKEVKFYNGTMKQEGNLYVLKFTKAYKPEYVGNEHKNKIALSGTTLTMEGADGKFKETWKKQ